MPTSNSYNYTTNRDAIITRALRIVGAIGQGETPSTVAVTEAAEALNDLIKEWETDGMSLWCVREYTFSPTAGKSSYKIGVGQLPPEIDAVAPRKVIQAWARIENRDTPIILITRQEYSMLGAKSSPGNTSQIWYDPPGEFATDEMYGTLSLYPVPDSFAESSIVYHLNGVRPYADFDSATDILDFPNYWNNAVKWGLADQLAYEYGVGLDERSRIERKADKHKEKALSYGTEEGHLLIQPMPKWQYESY